MGLITDNNETYYTGGDFGGYRYITLPDIVNNFMFAYVGDGKLISRANRRDVVFQAKRSMQEFSYDLSRVEKIQEFDVPSTLSIPMPQDYVNYVSISYIDSYGIEHPIPRGRITSAPSEAIAQDDQGNYTFDDNGDLATTFPQTIDRFNLNKTSPISASQIDEMYLYNTDIPNASSYAEGRVYGLEPELANRNAMFIIDELNGKINFSSDLVNVTLTLKYISDSLGSDEEMRVHKFAEEAIYKDIAYSILSTMSNIPEYIVNRFRRERRAAMRQAKLRLYDLKIPEIANIMRGKSKQIKH